MLTLKHAENIISGAISEARELDLAPICIAVLDKGGHLICLKREDGASNLRSQIATAKATGCLSLGVGGRILAKMAADRPAFVGSLHALSPGGCVPVAGGVLVRDSGGGLIGAVGVTGDTSDNDELCAIAGIRAVGLNADAGTPS